VRWISTVALQANLQGEDCTGEGANGSEGVRTPKRGHARLVGKAARLGGGARMPGGGVRMPGKGACTPGGGGRVCLVEGHARLVGVCTPSGKARTPERGACTHGGGAHMPGGEGTHA
jgi:hypothetical protein